MEHWNDHGYLVLRGFFDEATVGGYKRHLDALWRERAGPNNPLVMFGVRGGHPFRDALDDDREQTYRLCDQYLLDEPTRDLNMDPRLVDVLHQLMGHAPVVCNSLLFEWGSEQDMHSDMFFMPPVTANQMLATWIALDDVTDSNGPLVYVPGSHKIPPHRFSHGHVHAVTAEIASAVGGIERTMSDRGLRREKFYARAGDVLIWHGQLMHGGDAIRDRSARRTSLVTHYYSTCDVPQGPLLCAERGDGSLLLIKKHVEVARGSA